MHFLKIVYKVITLEKNILVTLAIRESVIKEYQFPKIKVNICNKKVNRVLSDLFNHGLFCFFILNQHNHT